MITKKLTDSISVAEQVMLTDIGSLAQAGFNTLINNRPDGEAPDQPSSEAIAKVAAEYGLAYHYIPVTPGIISDTNIADFKAVLSACSTPTLAFCRTGTRSTMLWGHAVTDTMPAKDIVSAAAGAGYDLSGLETTFAARNLK